MTRTCKITATVSGIALLLAALSGCASQYPFETPETPIEQTYDYEYLPHVKKETFDRKTTVEGLTFFYSSSLGGGKVDGAIQSVLEISEFCDVTQPVYLSKTVVTHASETEFLVNVQDDAALIGATYLAFAGGEALPFGCYAGTSAHLLNEKPSYTGTSLTKAIAKNPNVRELQYPFFTRNYGKSAERKTAWSLAQTTAKSYLSSHSLEELLQSEPSEWGEIFAEYGAEIPTEYTFTVGDAPYPIQVRSQNFRYHFAFDFNDRYFDNIALDYTLLREFVLDNEAFLAETADLLAGNSFPKAIDVFFGDYLLTDAFDISLEEISGATIIEQNAIVCDSLEGFSHEIIHAFLYYNSWGKHIFEEALCNYLSAISKHAPWFTRNDFLRYTGKSVYDKLLKRASESKQTLQAYKYYRKLYDFHFGSATKDTFDALKFSVCSVALRDREGMDPSDTWYYSAFRTSFVYYIHQTYGTEGLKNFIKNGKSAQYDGKTYQDIVLEWNAYLDSLLEENILKEWNAFQKKTNS